MLTASTNSGGGERTGAGTTGCVVVAAAVIDDVDAADPGGRIRTSTWTWNGIVTETVPGATPVATSTVPIDTVGVGVGGNFAISGAPGRPPSAEASSASSGSGMSGRRSGRDDKPGSAESNKSRSRLASPLSASAFNRVRIRLRRTPSLAIQSTSRSFFRSQTAPQRVRISLVEGSRRGTPEWCNPTSSQ